MEQAGAAIDTNQTPLPPGGGGLARWAPTNRGDFS